LLHLSLNVNIRFVDWIMWYIFFYHLLLLPSTDGVFCVAKFDEIYLWEMIYAPKNCSRIHREKQKLIWWHHTNAFFHRVCRPIQKFNWLMKNRDKFVRTCVPIFSNALIFILSWEIFLHAEKTPIMLFSFSLLLFIFLNKF
jgi:hypothetical protein